MAEQKVCSKCGQNPPSGKHSWCQACKAKYQREYEAAQDERAERRGFVKGADAMRSYLASALASRAGGMLLAGEVALWIRRAPRPDYEPYVKETESEADA